MQKVENRAEKLMNSARLNVPLEATGDVARRLGIMPAAVSYSVQRGEKTAKEGDRQLELMKL